VGTSGTNQRISLEVYSASLVRYMKTCSERHATKILNAKSAASIKRPASLKKGDVGGAVLDAEGDVGRAVLEAQVPIPPVPRKRKAPSLPTIPRRQSKV
jgi:hypothetical protein